MTHADRENPSKKVEIFFSINVVNKFPFTPIDNQRFLVVVGDARDQILLMLLVNVVLIHSSFPSTNSKKIWNRVVKNHGQDYSRFVLINKGKGPWGNPQGPFKRGGKFK